MQKVFFSLGGNGESLSLPGITGKNIAVIKVMLETCQYQK